MEEQQVQDRDHDLVLTKEDDRVRYYACKVCWKKLRAHAGIVGWPDLPKGGCKGPRRTNGKLEVSTYLHVDSNVRFPDRARLMVTVRVDGEEVGELTVLSGPVDDVTEYANGRMLLAELQAKWGMRK